MIYVKSDAEIARIRAACDVFRQVRGECLRADFVGMTLKRIDAAIKDMIQSRGATCAFHGYRGFPGHNCLSRNEVIIHGVPTDAQRFGPKDKLTLDLGIRLDGAICDAAFSLFGQECDPRYGRISAACEGAIRAAAAAIRPGARVGDAAHAIQTFLESRGYAILEGYGGHGCGLRIHEDPLVPNAGEPGTGPAFRAGMVVCVEPMALERDPAAYTAPDGWSVVSATKQPVGHFEHMVLVTPSGCEILTE